MAKNYWLMKSEPSTFSFDHLKACTNSTDHWDGVRNYQARNYMRDEMKVGDLVLFYHSSCPEPGIVGVAEITRESYPDYTALDADSKYFDPKSSSDNPRWFMVDVAWKEAFRDIVTLEKLKTVAGLKDMKVVQKGQRLSIQPVTAEEFKIVHKLGMV